MEATAQTQVDRIIYLASLVSDKRQIDAYLDPLRAFTASHNNLSAPLNDRDKQTLSHIEAEITNYLLTNERLRSYTPETLLQQVYERLDAPALVRRLRWQAAGMLAGGLVIAILTFLLVPFANTGLRINAAISIAIVVYYMAGCIWIQGSLKHFSPAMRAAWQVLVIGYIICATQQLITAVVKVLYHGTPPWQILWSFSTIPLLIAFVVMYLGCRRIAYVHNLNHSLGLSPWAVIGVWIVTSLPFIVIGDAFKMDPVNGLTPLSLLFCTSLIFWSAWLGFQISHRTSPLYHPPIYLLSWAAAIDVVAFLLLVIGPYTSPAVQQTLANIAALGFTNSVILLIRSAYTLNKLSRY